VCSSDLAGDEVMALITEDAELAVQQILVG
jgi:hypothetical protein